ncbi:MAG: radical SAM protein, partial [bacterium]|nr:radical SAM protein [bacterium]
MANPAVALAPVALRGPRLPPGWMLESRAGIHLLLHPDHPTWCAVNGFGLEIARLADGSRSVEELCAETSTQFEVGYEEVRRPVERFLEQLEGAGLLLGAEVAPPEPHPAPRVRVEHLNLHVAKGCNLSCRHCAVIDAYARGKQLGKAQLLRVIDQLAELDGASVALSGGEPLVRLDLPEILDYAAGKAHVILTTNGTLITGEIAAQLARVDATIEISIDGACAEIHDRIRGKGAFAAALRGIEHLAAAGIARSITFTTTITKANVDDLDGVIALAERVGAGFVRFSPVQPVERADRYWDEVGLTPAELRRAYRFLYLELGKRRVEISGGFPGFVLDFAKGEQWCSLGRTLALDPEGNIYPCQLFQHPDYRVGNVHEMSLRQATESPELLGTIRAAASRRYVVEDCKSCRWRNFCQGSCPASVRWQKGTLWATDELCDARRELYRDVVFGIAEGRRPSATPRTEVSVHAPGPRTVA